jgi:DNA repair exonuclease SbcCD ATPase subunit
MAEDKTRDEEFLEITNIILSTVNATSELLQAAKLSELDSIFGSILEKLNGFFIKVENSFREFIIFERYVACAYTRELGYTLLNIPDEVKDRVWKYKDNPDICGFTGEECVCKKSTDYLKNSFLEKINMLKDSGNLIRKSSESLKEGIQDIGKGVAELTNSAKRIMSIAEVIEIIALNAYIEAARLGEHGRGFKVIADEVRKASNRTNELAHEIVESIRLLHKRFTQQVERQEEFDTQMNDLESEQRKLSEDLNIDLVLMTQNFIDFIDYVRRSIEEDMHMLSEVRQTILGVLQSIDLANQRAMNTYQALLILARMIDEFEDVLRGTKEVDDAYSNVQSLYSEFKNIPKLHEEREIIARTEGKAIDKDSEVVGEKLEDVDTDVELF